MTKAEIAENWQCALIAENWQCAFVRLVDEETKLFDQPLGWDSEILSYHNAPIRVFTALREHLHIVTLRDLLACSEKELLHVPNFGTKSLKELKAELAQHGFTLRKN